MSTSKVNMSLDDIIKERRTQNRSFRGRGGRNSRGFNGSSRGRGGLRGNRMDRGGRRERGRQREGGRRERGNWQRNEGNRRTFAKRRFSVDGNKTGARLFIKDLPKTINNTDLRVLIIKEGNFWNMRYLKKMWYSLGSNGILERYSRC